MKRLTRSRTEKKIAGICGGLGIMMEIDPTIVRLVLVALALLTAVVPLVVAYLVAWAIVPEEAG